MVFFNRRVDPRIPDTVEWDTQIVEGATVAEFAELPARYGIRTTQIFNPDAVACEIAVDEYSPFTPLTRIYTGSPTASEYYADGGSAYIFLHVDNLGKYARASIYPGGTVITAERLASDEFKGDQGIRGPAGDIGLQGPAGPAMDAAINAASDKTSPADADRIGFTDSAASYGLKRFTFADLFTWIVSKVFALTGKTTPVDADGFLITDSAASNVGKWLSWANLKATLKDYFDTQYKPAFWVNFDGTGASPITPRASYNVTDITKDATGVFTINLTNAVGSANFAVTASISANFATDTGMCNIATQAGTSESAPTTTAISVMCIGRTTGTYDPKYVMIVGFL